MEGKVRQRAKVPCPAARWGRPSFVVACLLAAHEQPQTTKTDRLRHYCSGPLEREVFARLNSPGHVPNQRNKKQNQEHKEQNLGNSRRRDSNTSKTQHSRKECDEKEHQSVIKHIFDSSFPGIYWPCL